MLGEACPLKSAMHYKTGSHRKNRKSEQTNLFQPVCTDFPSTMGRKYKKNPHIFFLISA